MARGAEYQHHAPSGVSSCVAPSASPSDVPHRRHAAAATAVRTRVAGVVCDLRLGMAASRFLGGCAPDDLHRIERGHFVKYKGFHHDRSRTHVTAATGGHAVMPTTTQAFLWGLPVGRRGCRPQLEFSTGDSQPGHHTVASITSGENSWAHHRMSTSFRVSEPASLSHRAKYAPAETSRPVSSIPFQTNSRRPGVSAPSTSILTSCPRTL